METALASLNSITMPRLELPTFDPHLPDIEIPPGPLTADELVQVLDGIRKSQEREQRITRAISIAALLFGAIAAVTGIVAVVSGGG